METLKTAGSYKDAAGSYTAALAALEAARAEYEDYNKSYRFFKADYKEAAAAVKGFHYSDVQTENERDVIFITATFS